MLPSKILKFETLCDMFSSILGQYLRSIFSQALMLKSVQKERHFFTGHPFSIFKACELRWFHVNCDGFMLHDSHAF